MGNTQGLPFIEVAEFIANHKDELDDIDICIDPNINFELSEAYKEKNSASTTSVIFSDLVYKGLKSQHVAMKIFINANREYIGKIISYIDKMEKLDKKRADKMIYTLKRYTAEEAALKYEGLIYKNSVNKMLAKRYTPCLIPFLAFGTCSLDTISQKTGVDPNDIIRKSLLNSIIQTLDISEIDRVLKRNEIELDYMISENNKVAEDIVMMKGDIETLENVKKRGVDIIEKIREKILLLETIKQTVLDLENEMAQNISVNILITERFPPKSMIMHYFLKPNIWDIDTVTNVVFMCLYSIAVFEELGIVHHDMHAGNVIVTKYDDYKVLVFAISEDNIFLVSTKYIPYIFDWDRAYDISQGLNANLHDSDPNYGRVNRVTRGFDYSKFLCYVSLYCKDHNITGQICTTVAKGYGSNSFENNCSYPLNIRDDIYPKDIFALAAFSKLKIDSLWNRISLNKISPKNVFCLPSVDRKKVLKNLGY